MSAAARDLIETAAGARLAVILGSYRRLTGAPLAADAGGLWSHAAAVLAHDTGAPPRFFYANRAALALFRSDARGLIGMASHRSAEPAHRDERAAMLARLERDELVTGYRGIRIAADGTRFLVEDATIWNLRDAAGTLHGQAALLPQWTLLAAADR